MVLVRNLIPLFLASSYVGAFVPPTSGVKPTFVRPSIVLAAEGGAPQYDKREAKLLDAEVVGEGSVMLHLEKTDNEPLDYKAGHVLALEIKDPGTVSLDEKVAEDAKKNGGWMRGPYTVSRASDDSFDVLIKVVGGKSKTMASAAPGTTFKYGGKFHVPICDGINKEDTKRVVLISTGVGIGPCIGAIEEMIADVDFNAKIDLFSSFRTESDVVSPEYLNSLVEKNPDKFKWTTIITSNVGRISDSEENIRLVTSSDVCGVKDTHYHLIGNGQLVNEWKSGLAKAGVPEDKVTIESYFNHRMESDKERVERIAKVVSAAALSPAQ